MSGAGHTEGPWRHKPETAVGNGDFAICGEVGRHRLALVYARPGDVTAKTGETLANARLIAAAPDLLASLKALLLETELTYATQLRDRQDEARAAIAKAEAR